MTAELLDAIAESPNDDGPRLVYADWLQQQPDEARRARGEYISLTCSTARNPKRSLRIQELFERHVYTWLGPVATVTDPRRRLWARGFLDSAALLRHDRPEIESALGHPAWRTLRVLTAHDTTISEPDVHRIICQRELSNLRALYVLQHQLPPLAESAQAPRVTELAVAPSGLALQQVFPVLAAACFAKLRRLHLFGCTPSMIAQLDRPDLTLIAVVVPGTVAFWIQELDALRAKLTEVRLVSDVFPLLERRGFELVIKPDADRRWNGLEIRWSEHDDARRRDDILLHLSRLPVGSAKTLSLIGPPTARFDVDRWKTRLLTAVRHLDLAIE